MLAILSALIIAQIEAGKVSLEAMEFDAVSLMENLVDMMSVHSARKGIELVLDVAGKGVFLTGFNCEAVIDSSFKR